MNAIAIRALAIATINLFLLFGLVSFSFSLAEAGSASIKQNESEYQSLNQALSLRLTHLLFRTVFQEYFREGLTEKRPNFLIHRYYLETFLAQWDQEIETQPFGKTTEIWRRILEKTHAEYLGSSYQIWQRTFVDFLEHSQPEVFKSLKPFQITIGYYRQTFLGTVLRTERETDLELRIMQIMDQVGFLMLNTSEDFELGISMIEPFLHYPDYRVSKKASEMIISAPKSEKLLNWTRFILGAVGLKSIWSNLYKNPVRLSTAFQSGMMQLSKLSGAIRLNVLRKLNNVPKMKALLSQIQNSARRKIVVATPIATAVALHGGLLIAMWPEKDGAKPNESHEGEDGDQRDITKFQVLADLALRSQRTDGLLESSFLEGRMNSAIGPEMKLSRAETIKKLEEVLFNLKMISNGNTSDLQKKRRQSLLPLILAYENTLGLLPAERELFYLLANRRMVALRARVEQMPAGGYELLRQLLLTEELFNYRKLSNDLNSVIIGWGGNCVSQTLLFLALFTEYPHLLPSDRRLKVAIFLDHIELAFESEKEWQLIVKGRRIDRKARVSVFDPEVLLAEMIRILKSTPEGKVFQSNPLESPQIKIYPTKFSNLPIPDHAHMKYIPLDQITDENETQVSIENTDRSEKVGKNKSSLARGNNLNSPGANSPANPSAPVGNSERESSDKVAPKSELKYLNGFVSTEGGRIPVCISFGDLGFRSCFNQDLAGGVVLGKLQVQWGPLTRRQMIFDFAEMSREQKQKIYSDLTSLPQGLWSLYLANAMSLEFLKIQTERTAIVDFFVREAQLEMSEGGVSFYDSLLQAFEMLTRGALPERPSRQLVEKVGGHFHPLAGYLSRIKQIYNELSNHHQAQLKTVAQQVYTMPRLDAAKSLVESFENYGKFFRMLTSDPLVFLGLVIQTKKLAASALPLQSSYEEFLKKNPAREKDVIFIFQQVGRMLEKLRTSNDKPKIELKRMDISRYEEKAEAKQVKALANFDMPEVHCSKNEDCPFFYVLENKKSSAPKIAPEEVVVIDFNYEELVLLAGFTGQGVALWSRQMLENVSKMDSLHQFFEPISEINLKQRSGLDVAAFAKNMELSEKYDDLQSLIRQFGRSYKENQKMLSMAKKSLTQEEKKLQQYQFDKYYQDNFKSFERQLPGWSNNIPK